MALSPLSNLLIKGIQDVNGNLIPYRYIYLYQTGTTIPIPLYQDSGGNTPLSQPFQTNSSGTMTGVGYANLSANPLNIDIYDPITRYRAVESISPPNPFPGGGQYLQTSQLGQPSGVGSLDSTGHETAGEIALSVVLGTEATATGAVTISSPTTYVDATGGAFTITLPTAVNFVSEYVIEAITTTTNKVTINTTGGQTVGGYASGTLALGTQASGAPYQSISLRSDSANWRII